MNNKTKFIGIVIFCFCFLQISVFAQLNPLDKEINLREKELNALKEKRIKEYEAEIARMKAEVDKLKDEPAINTILPLAATSVTSSQNDANPQAATQSANPINNFRNSASQTELNCFPAPTEGTEKEKLCDMARATIVNGRGRVSLANSRAELAFIFGNKLNAALTAATAVNTTSTAALESLLADSEKKRTDKQVGASSGNSGTTSLVVKGGAPAIIGWAVENGAATSSVYGNTVTVRVNPYNFGRAFFLKHRLFDIKYYDDTLSKGNNYFDLSKLSFGFSFDTTRGTDTPTFIVSKQQLASWSVRYEFINRRNPLSKYNTERRNQYFKAQTPNIINFSSALETALIEPNFVKTLAPWLDKVNTELKVAYLELAGQDAAINCNKIPPPANPRRDEIIQTCREAVYQIVKQNLDNNFPAEQIVKDETITKNFSVLSGARQTFLDRRKEFLNEVNKEMVATFEYTNNREVNAPDTSNFRFIVERGVYIMKPKDGEGEPLTLDFTVNAEMTMYHKKPAGTDVKRIKDFNLAFQIDAPLKDMMLFNDSVLSFAFRYTRQASDVILPNGVVADGTKGDILFGQAKLTIPIGDTGIKLPLSYTFANRSEFVKERFGSGNFGITFDLDQLFRLGTFSR